jgi:hypothetical protein
MSTVCGAHPSTRRMHPPHAWHPSTRVWAGKVSAYLLYIHPPCMASIHPSHPSTTGMASIHHMHDTHPPIHHAWHPSIICMTSTHHAWHPSTHRNIHHMHDNP